MAGAVAVAVFQSIPFTSALSFEPVSKLAIAQINSELGVSGQWRALALVPFLNENAIFSLAIPVAVLLLGCQLQRQERTALLLVMLAIGLFSGFWGLLQITGSQQGPLYMYNLTNDGAAVGLFANRNHQATLLACLFPLLAGYAMSGVSSPEQARSRGITAIAAAIFLVPLILVTGSRSGLVLAIIGALLALLIYKAPKVGVEKRRRPKSRAAVYAVAGLGAITLGAITILMSRAQAVSRLSSRNAAEDLRVQIWEPIAEMSVGFLPLGSGVGSFAFTYRVYEPDSQLMASYINQAHNDFIDVFLTAGAPGLLILIFALASVVRVGLTAFRKSRDDSQSVLFMKLGMAVSVLIAIASITDYPVRTPIVSSILSICMLWMFALRKSSTEKAGTC